jgi:DNA-binding NarL/FixJ family response regulator
MGKLVDKIRDISQTGGSGFGFLGRTPANARKPRPAAILVTLKANDTASAEAAAKNGADAVILADWTPSANLKALKAALEAASTLWGVEIQSASANGDTLQRAREAGAAFAILAPSASAATLFEEVEHFDRVVTVEPPKDDLALLLLRGQSLLPAQAAVVPLQLGAKDLAGLTISDFTRLKLIVESLRFPALVTLGGVPDAAGIKTLIQLGAAGLILTSAENIGTAVKSLREELERTPIPSGERTTVLLGGLVGGAGEATPTPPRREPEREPEREPQHE